LHCEQQEQQQMQQTIIGIQTTANAAIMIPTIAPIDKSPNLVKSMAHWGFKIFE
jgi:hypothetical protein